MKFRVFERRFEQFREALRDAQQDRDLLPVLDRDTPYWNTYEKMIMWKAVNQARREKDLPYVPHADIEAVEQQASGHFDYTKKFALYCAELVDKEWS